MFNINTHAYQQEQDQKHCHQHHRPQKKNQLKTDQALGWALQQALEQCMHQALQQALEQCMQQALQQRALEQERNQNCLLYVCVHGVGVVLTILNNNFLKLKHKSKCKTLYRNNLFLAVVNLTPTQPHL